MNPQQRHIGLDLLRIVSMFFIIAVHACITLRSAVIPGTAAYTFTYSLLGVSVVSVNCYVLISGYFLCTQRFRLKKLLMLLGQIFFYSVLVALGVRAAGLDTFTAWDRCLILTPTVSGLYWFATTYVALYLLSPFLNRLIAGMNQSLHLALVLLTTALFCVVPDVAFLGGGLSFGGPSGIVWMATLYLLAAYLRKYDAAPRRAAVYVLPCLVVTALIPLSRFGFQWLADAALTGWVGGDTLSAKLNQLYYYNAILPAASSVLIFQLFRHLDVTPKRLCKAVSVLAPLTFGVYLIHDNPFFSGFLWRGLRITLYADRMASVAPAIAGSVLIVFIGCAAIEFLRARLFRRINNSRWLDRLCTRMEDGIRGRLLRWTRSAVPPRAD